MVASRRQIGQTTLNPSPFQTIKFALNPNHTSPKNPSVSRVISARILNRLGDKGSAGARRTYAAFIQGLVGSHYIRVLQGLDKKSMRSVPLVSSL